MAGNETIIYQTMQLIGGSVALYFYTAMAGFLAFIGFEAFNRWMNRKETEDFHRDMLDIHRGKTLAKATREEDEEGRVVVHYHKMDDKLEELLNELKKKNS